MPLARASWNPCEDRFGAHRSVLSARSRLSTVVPMDTRPRRVMARCRVGTAAKIAAVADGAAQRLLHTVRDEIAVTAAREAGSTALWGSAEAELRFHVLGGGAHSCLQKTVAGVKTTFSTSFVPARL